MASHPPVTGPFCEKAGKPSYFTRRAARQRAKRAKPGEHLAQYRCGDHWHNGHLPQAALVGIKSRVEVYR